MLETEAQIATHAHEIYMQAGVSHAMPPPSQSYIEAEDRAMIVAWFEGAEG